MKRLALVVDDDVLVRRMVARELERRGFRVREAADGEAALYVARWLRPEVVVTDDRMPDLAGRDLVRALRTSGCEASVLVMFSGGKEPPEDVDAFVSKREGIAALARELDALLGGAR